MLQSVCLLALLAHVAAQSQFLAKERGEQGTSPEERQELANRFFSVICGGLVWFTFDVTLGFGMKNFNVLPMIIYPFGIALRDYKKKVNLEQAIKTFRV